MSGHLLALIEVRILVLVALECLTPSVEVFDGVCEPRCIFFRFGVGPLFVDVLESKERLICALEPR